MSATRRTVLCSCGGDIYTATYGFDADSSNPMPVWRCENCHAETPRKSSHRRTNRSRAIDAYLSLRKLWAPVDEQLDELVKSGAAMSGALLVHSSTFNYHLRKLSDLNRPTNFDVRYHAEQARLELVNAQAFVQAKQLAAKENSTDPKIVVDSGSGIA